MTVRSFTIEINTASVLPTVLTALALHSPGFNVLNQRNPHGVWRVEVLPMEQDALVRLVDVLPSTTTTILEWKDHTPV